MSNVWRGRISPSLSDSAAHIEVILGDARLSMERELPQGFDILVLDAFSGDAIPVLLTKEAFVIYRRHLCPEGAIAGTSAIATSTCIR
jgi:spermidine synthase